MILLCIELIKWTLAVLNLLETLAQTAKENGITKTALMIIGDAVKQSGYQRSLLYDPGFSTEFRKASHT